jgi:hypothetical protein
MAPGDIRIDVAGTTSIGSIAAVGNVYGNIMLRVEEEDELTTTRRLLLQAITAGLGLGPLAAGLRYSEELRSSIESSILRGAISRPLFLQWEEVVEEHVYSYAVRPPKLLLIETLTDFVDISAALDRCRSPKVQRDLLRLVARLAGITAVLIDDLGDTTQARRWMRVARLAATQSGENALRAWTYARESFFLLHYGQSARAAIDLADRAIAASRRNKSSSATIMGHSVRARALARLAASSDSIEALSDAERLYASPAQGVGLFGWSLQQLMFSAGRTLTSLSRTRDALYIQDQALTLFSPDELLDPVLIKLDKAQALIRDGDVSGGCQFAVHTLEGIPPDFTSPLIASWADDAISAVPHRRRRGERVKALLSARRYLDGAGVPQPA